MIVVDWSEIEQEHRPGPILSQPPDVEDDEEGEES